MDDVDANANGTPNVAPPAPVVEKPMPASESKVMTKQQQIEARRSKWTTVKAGVRIAGGLGGRGTESAANLRGPGSEQVGGSSSSSAGVAAKKNSRGMVDSSRPLNMR